MERETVHYTEMVLEKESNQTKPHTTFLNIIGFFRKLFEGKFEILRLI